MQPPAFVSAVLAYHAYGWSDANDDLAVCARAGFRNDILKPRLAPAHNAVREISLYCIILILILILTFPFQLARLELISGIVCDGAIAASLTYYLSSYRTGTLRFVSAHIANHYGRC